MNGFTNFQDYMHINMGKSIQSRSSSPLVINTVITNHNMKKNGLITMSLQDYLSVTYDSLAATCNLVCNLEKSCDIQPYIY